MKEKIPNIPRSKNTEFLYYITESTASAFAMLINPKRNDPTIPLTAERIARVSFIQFHMSGYYKESKIFPYRGLSTSYTAEEYWIKNSQRMAQQLLLDSGMIEEEYQDDL